jgi:hypothetical protein
MESKAWVLRFRWVTKFCFQVLSQWRMRQRLFHSHSKVSRSAQLELQQQQQRLQQQQLQHHQEVNNLDDFKILEVFMKLWHGNLTLRE